ncbi:cytochrome C oxidase subunit IV family protein [Ekhidna sp.]|uniref:cytochrome C oxidase subunit IV family protein n=1 Tax=Ekhidna sp. TaxID=2608089 RepID=UPI003C7DA2D6
MEQQTSQVEVKPVNKAKVKNFLKVMWYLAAITAIEFAIAFTVPHEHKWVRIIVFIALTIVKAYYIVSEFMHLGHEKKSLKMSIVLPMLFVVFLIFIMIYQGDAILKALY